MLRPIREQIIKRLWENYRQASVQVRLVEDGIKRKKENALLLLDHFAVIDLPSKQSGIPVLTQIFSALGYVARGRDYLPSKQNDFLWLAESDHHHLQASEALPQVVVADFRLEELSSPVRKVIEKYANLTSPAPLNEITQLINQIHSGNDQAQKQLENLLLIYFAGRDWPLPTVKEFLTVQECNELLAWVLVFGRRPNHFTFSIHLLDGFSNFPQFLAFVEEDLKLPLNDEGGRIKGSKASGIAQSSTQGWADKITLADGEIHIPNDFVEFVWRYPLTDKPSLWTDYFTGFVASHADHVIESLYV